MPVHTLQRADDDPVFRSQHTKGITANVLHARSSGERFRDGSLFSGLSQSTDVNLDELGQSRQHKVPLVSEAISPAALFELRVEMCAHEFNHIRRVGVGIQIEITSKIRPVVK